MTLGRLGVFAVALLVLLLLLIPIMEATLALRGASLLIAIAGILTVFGGAFGVIGAVKNNQEQVALYLGDPDTFCQLIVYRDSSIGLYLATYHYGPGRAYGVKALLAELDENGDTMRRSDLVDVGDLTGDTWPVGIHALGINGPQTKVAPRYFTAQITQRNGTSLQDLVIYPHADGRVGVAFSRLEFQGRPYSQRLDRMQPQDGEEVQLSSEEINRVRAVFRRWKGPWR